MLSYSENDSSEIVKIKPAFVQYPIYWVGNTEFYCCRTHQCICFPHNFLVSLQSSKWTGGYKLLSTNVMSNSKQHKEIKHYGYREFLSIDGFASFSSATPPQVLYSFLCIQFRVPTINCVLQALIFHTLYSILFVTHHLNI